jgi:SAM-dependent methyltransferase
VALPPQRDAYGQILLAHFEGRVANEIMERDDGLIYCGDPADYFHPFRRWPANERRAMRHVRGRVLDIGCGAGRVALHLQDRGHEVVAVDESPLAVEVARQRGVRDARVLALSEVDRSLGMFDTVLLLRNNIGLAGDGRSTPPLLRRLARLTSARARIFTDSVDPERLEDPAFRTYGKRAQRLRVRWRGYSSPWFRYVMVPPAELERLLTGGGWRVLRVIDDSSPRYIVVLEKDARPS